MRGDDAASAGRLSSARRPAIEPGWFGKRVRLPRQVLESALKAGCKIGLAAFRHLALFLEGYPHDSSSHLKALRGSSRLLRQRQRSARRGCPQDEAVAAAEFVVGNAMFVMFHEIGHMLISAYDIPVLGKEEDAVDNLATVIMLMSEDEVTAKALADSADAWFMFQERADAQGYENDYSGVHSPDQARAYQIVCLMYGADPKAFKDVADAAELPEDRRQTCGEEYQQASNSWDKLLSEHIVEGDDVKTKSRSSSMSRPPICPPLSC